MAGRTSGWIAGVFGIMQWWEERAQFAEMAAVWEHRRDAVATQTIPNGIAERSRSVEQSEDHRIAALVDSRTPVRGARIQLQWTTLRQAAISHGARGGRASHAKQACVARKACRLAPHVSIVER